MSILDRIKSHCTEYKEGRFDKSIVKPVLLVSTGKDVEAFQEQLREDSGYLRRLRIVFALNLVAVIPFLGGGIVGQQIGDCILMDRGEDSQCITDILEKKKEELSDLKAKN